MMLNQETGNTSLGDKQRADILFEKTGAKSYLDKADYSAAIKEVMEEYKSSGNWDAYLSMDKWQQSLNDYASVPVYFDRSIMERNGVKGSCSFATVKTAEEIQKETDDRVKAAEKNGPTLREALANAFPNAVNTLYSFVGSSVVMTFDEYVKAMEEMLRKNRSKCGMNYELQPLRIQAGWKVEYNNFTEYDMEEDGGNDWLEWNEDLLRLYNEKANLIIDLGWYPDGDIKGSYRLVAILDDHWNKPILELKTRSTQEVGDTMELWMFETFADWKNTYPEDKEETI